MIALLSLMFASAATPVELIPRYSVWSYLDTGLAPAATWVDTGFDDSTWATGPAPLGYGVFEATTVDYGIDPVNRYITTWFRNDFSIADPSVWSGLTASLRLDDGAVVYLNGTEVHRANLPPGSTPTTTALLDISGIDESTYNDVALPTSLLVTGVNQLAVEVHQYAASSDDLAFDLGLTGWDGPPAIVRGPYLQNLTPTSVIIRWRTDTPSVAQVGIDGRILTGPLANDHSIEVAGLTESNSYSYSVGTPTEVLAGGVSDPLHTFRTAPVPGSTGPIRIWAIGDAGTGDANQAAVRDAFLDLSEPADVWLMLGDNAYNSGTDTEYQTTLFDIYGTILPNTPVWSTLGNHDGYSASSATQSGPYYDIFDLPSAGEAGGEPSGTEAYYSFDYGNVHFVCLDSYDSSRFPGDAMLDWLEDDLSTTNADWVIAFWHHPPYSKGSHDSDFESNMVDMRQNALPILESYGVDLVLSGHSHSYERSMLIDGHYNVSSTFDSTMQRNASSGNPLVDGAYTKPSLSGGSGEGAVYVVAGSSGKISGGLLNHPAMHANLNSLGSVVIDVDGARMDVRFVNDLGAVSDAFTVERGVTSVLEMSIDAPAVEATAVSLHAYAQDPFGNEALSYEWDFGDGTPTAVGADVVHLWPDDGVFPVTVTARDASGYEAVRVLLLDVANLAPVITDFGSDPALEGTRIGLYAVATDVASDTVSLAWDFGDGSTAFGTDVEHVYLQDGTYTVTITASDEDGGSSTASFSLVVADLPPEQQTIYVSKSYEGVVTVLNAGNDPEAVTWSWDLHDGTTPRTSPTIEHIWYQDGPKPVTLTVTDLEGDSSRTSISVPVLNVAPHSLQVSQAFGGNEGDLLAFSASAEDPGDDFLSYTWDFGDGSFPVSGGTVQHAFADDGPFTVEVTVSDGDGGTATLSLGVTIQNVAPRFTTFSVPTTLDEGTLGLFLAIAEDPGRYDNVDVTWDFGDGLGSVISEEVRRAFDTEGLYRITATVDDEDGGRVVREAAIEVRNAAPVISSTPPTAAAANVVYRYAVAATDAGGDVLSYTLSGPSGSVVGPAGVITWTPQRPAQGVPFTVTVSDGTDSRTQSWIVDVSAGQALAGEPTIQASNGCQCDGSTSSPTGVLGLVLLALARRRSA